MRMSSVMALPQSHGRRLARLCRQMWGGGLSPAESSGLRRGYARRSALRNGLTKDASRA